MSKVKTSGAEGFTRIKRDGRYVYTKPTPGGGEVVKDGNEYQAYDVAGNYLGFTADPDVAEAMAFSGAPNVLTTDHASELDLWAVWNAALDSKQARFMGDDDGNQILSLGQHFFMRAKPDEHGYRVDLLTDTEMDEEYWDEEKQVFHLRVLSGGILRLE